MKAVAVAVVLCAAMAGVAGYSASARPPYVECLSSDECGKEGCCVIGMGRYSIPTCQPRRDRRESCRPSAEPSNVTLHYPDDAVVRLTDVYYIGCPCLGGLTCGGSGECDEGDYLLDNDPFLES